MPMINWKLCRAAQAGESRYQTDTEAKEAANALNEKSGEFQQGLLEQQTEYGQTQGIAENELANAATGMSNSENIATPALQTLQGDIENKNTRAMQDTAKQVGANLATQGVRGGQAAILQNRAVGEQGLSAQEDIDELLAQQAAATQAQQAGYNTQLAGGAMSKIGAS